MQNKDIIKLFHLEASSYNHIVNLLQQHLHHKPLEQLIAIYAGASGFSILSADAEIDTLLIRNSGKELLQNSLLHYALCKEPQLFHFYYGNKELIKQFQLQ